MYKHSPYTNPEFIKENKKGSIPSEQLKLILESPHRKNFPRSGALMTILVVALSRFFFPSFPPKWEFLFLVPIIWLSLGFLIAGLIHLGVEKYWKSKIIPSDNTLPELASCTGEVKTIEKFYKQIRYQICPGNTFLITRYNRPINIPEGKYTFYYLKHSGLVLSAEMQEETVTTWKDTHNRTLAALLDFNSTDIESNRNGKITDKQKSLLAKRKTIFNTSFLILLIPTLYFIPILGLVFLALLAHDYLITIHNGREFGTGIHMYEGKLKISDFNDSYRNSIMYTLVTVYRVFGRHNYKFFRSLLLPTMIGDAVLSGTTYRAFFDKETYRILSIEVIE